MTGFLKKSSNLFENLPGSANIPARLSKSPIKKSPIRNHQSIPAGQSLPEIGLMIDEFRLLIFDRKMHWRSYRNAPSSTASSSSTIAGSARVSATSFLSISR